MLTWIGKDDSSELSSSKSFISKNIFADTIESVNIEDSNKSWYKTPENITAVALDAISGEPTKDLSKAALFYYVKGSEFIKKE